MTNHHILVINPNTTVSMTEKIGQAARLATSPKTRITAVNPARGPAAIQGPDDGAAALPGLFDLFDERVSADRSITAVIIACFDDTGLWELKQKAPIPVIGIGEAAYHIASLAAVRFSVITTLSVSVPVLEDNLRHLGLSSRCARVRASDVPVLALEDPGSDARVRIEGEIERALGEDDIGAVVLGCAGMADLAGDLSARYKVPVIDGVASAICLCKILASQRY